MSYQTDQRNSNLTQPNRIQYEDADYNNQDINQLHNVFKVLKDSQQNLNLSATSAALSQIGGKGNDPSQDNLREFNYEDDDDEQDQYVGQKNIEDIRRQQSESLLSKAHDNNSMLQKKLMEAEQEVDKCNQKIAHFASINHIQMQQIQELREQLEFYTHSQQNLVEKSKQNTNLIEKDMEEKELALEQQDRLIQELQAMIMETEEKMNYIMKNNSNYEDQNTKLRREYELKQKENDRIKSKLEEVEKVIDDVYLDKTSKGTALLDIEYLKSDIQRLLNLLKSTHEFQEFSMFAEDSNDIRFLKHVGSQMNAINNRNGFGNKANCQQTCGCTQKEGSLDRATIEQMIWVPNDAFQFARDIICQNDQPTEVVIQELLFGLNQIWTKRQESQVLRVQNRYENDINNLKRQLNRHVSFDEIHAKRKISRLKSELSQARKDTDVVAFEKNKNQGKDKLIYFTDALKLASQYETELRFKQEEIRELQEQLSSIEEQAISYDKLIYMEGALWMINKTIKQLNKFKTLIQKIETEFSIELDKHLVHEDRMNDSRKLIKLHQWFIENIDQFTEGVIEKMKVMRESTQRQLKKIGGSQLEENRPQIMDTPMTFKGGQSDYGQNFDLKSN